MFVYRLNPIDGSAVAYLEMDTIAAKGIIVDENGTVYVCGYNNDGRGYVTKLYLDSDDDGLSDIEENAIGTNPNYYDSDHDGLNDYKEYKIYNQPIVCRHG